MDDPRDATVAVAKGVHGDEVQVRHRYANGDVRVEVAVLEPVDELAHERRDVLVSDLDVTHPIQGRVLGLLEVAGVEVQVEDDAVDPISTGHSADLSSRGHRETHVVDAATTR